jgi:metal-dependent amidase/aminoacylase/carboxypeptidase family protein
MANSVHQINALDAMVAAFSNIGMLRQQSKPGDVISGFITNGGSAINVIPAYTSAAIGTRAPTKSNLNELDKRVYSCCEAGALASGAKLNFLHQGGYEDHVPNSVLADLYRKWFNVLGGSIAGSKEDAENGTSPGGTDQGNVSHVLPSLHALFQIEAPCGPHQLEFAAAAKADGAHERAIRVAKALALTALDILLDKKILEDIKKTFVPDIVE